LLEPWLKQARLTCQVEVRKGAPPVGATYRARPVAGGLELVVATAELEGVAAPEPDTLALAPVDVAGEGAAGRLLDYQAFGRRLAQLRESAGRNGLNLTVVKQRLVIGELRTLLEGSTRGLGAATKVNAEAVRLDERLAAAKTRIRDSARREIRQGDEDAPAEYEIPKSVDELKARASGYGRYFRAVLLPSNGLLTSQALARILEAEELDLVAEAGVASDPDEEDKPVRKRRVLETPVVADPFAVDPAPGKPAPAARAAPVRVERLLFFHPDDPRRPLLTVVVTEVP
jgi:hypothetical protein